MFIPPCDLHRPEEVTLPLVFSSPHSGSVYPPNFVEQSRLDARGLRRSEDAFVDSLFKPVVAMGAPLLAARFPRAYLDLNREPYELDPQMFEGRLPPFANTRSMRVAGGLGTIPRVVGESQEIYARRLPAEEATRRVEALYKPYHASLRRLMDQAHAEFGFAILIDCHSMPSTSFGKDEPARADIVLGDRFGTSCSGMITDSLEAELRNRGLSVLRNKPYAGGFITEHYGRPARSRHAIQIEINRALYMDERALARHEGFDRLAVLLADAMRAFGEAPLAYLAAGRLAAE
ncbi:N-formylglutamate amidohydrolase [Terrarubrum flagellatum]|uniref:N-formylglutamate amidohydrolase n=1 Tax=Terrirubrum flagellatum TaxID=2895980 RepID=UPI0031456ECE